MQTTIENDFSHVGTGVHLGRPARINIRPAPVDHGIVFKRIDVDDSKSIVKANFENILSSELCTSLTNSYGVSVKTVEHLLAAFSGIGVTNALVEIDNEEVPILDGSSLRFVQSLIKAGICKQHKSLNVCTIKKSIKVKNRNSWVKLIPSNQFILTVIINYPNTCIGKQKFKLSMKKDSFVKELSDNRTFCLKKDIQIMRSKGFALGGSLENAIVVDGYKIMNPNGLRRKDEFVRHKMLDALGDLALSGLPLLGHYISFCGGHKLNNQLISKLFSDSSNYQISKLCTKNSLEFSGQNFDSQTLKFRAVS